MPTRHIHPRASGMITFKGGGDDTIESIPDWYKPFVETAASGAQAAFDRGDLSKVEGFNEMQKQGIQGLADAAGEADKQYDMAKGATGVLQQASQGEGIYGAGATEALRNKAIRDSQKAYAPVGTQMATQGAIGGARSQIIQGDRDAALAGALAEVDYNDLDKRRTLSTNAAQGIIGNTAGMQDAAGSGANYLGEAGGFQQEQSQREGDAVYQGLQRLGGLLSGAPVPQQGPSGGK